MTDDVQRALAELVRREVEAALSRHGIGSEQGTEPAGSVHGGIPIRPTPDLVQCPSCGYEFRPSESWRRSASKGESTGTGTSHTESSTDGSDRSRSHSITSQSTTEGTTETETGTESVSGTSYPE